MVPAQSFQNPRGSPTTSVWNPAAWRRKHHCLTHEFVQRVRVTAGSVQTQRGDKTQSPTAPGVKVGPAYMLTPHTHTALPFSVQTEDTSAERVGDRSRDQESVSLGSLSSLPVTREGFTEELELQLLGGGKPQPVWIVSRQVKIFKFTFVRRFEVIYNPVKTPDATASKHCQASETT